MKRVFAETYRISKVFNAPLSFVYRWCTDFREDDLKMVGSKTKRMMLERNSKHVVWRNLDSSAKKGLQGIRSVRLMPPNRWHLDTTGDKHLVGDYRLTRLGGTRTRLDMKFVETSADRRKLESPGSWEAETQEEWDTYGRYLERDYRRHLRPK